MYQDWVRAYHRTTLKQFKWYRLAAEPGERLSAASASASGIDAGEGVPQDYGEAVKWYRLAADQGHALSAAQTSASCITHRRGRAARLR